MNTPGDIKNVLAQTLLVMQQSKRGWKRLGFTANIIAPLVSAGTLKYNGSSTKDLADRYQRKIKKMFTEMKETQVQNPDDETKHLLNMTWKLKGMTAEISELVIQILITEEELQKRRIPDCSFAENTQEAGDFGDMDDLPDPERKKAKMTNGYMNRAEATKIFEGR